MTRQYFGCNIQVRLPSHASRPSPHVWSIFGPSRVCAHFLCQAPPGAQQLRLPLLNVLHLGHVPLAVVEMAAVGVTAVVVVSGAAVATVVLATVVTGGGKSAGVDKLRFKNKMNK